MKWTKEEDKLIQNYFRNKVTQATLYQNIHKINPHRTFDAIARKIRRYKDSGEKRLKDKAWENLRVGYLDIESTGLKGNFAYMLTWYIKKANKDEYDYSIITKKEIFDEKFDKRLVEELLEAFNNYDILYTHYGSDRRFDMPFIRTRVYKHGLEEKFPEYMEKFLLDTYPIARNKLKLHSNRLESIAETLNIKNVRKTKLMGEIWMSATVGNPKALEYIALHNKRDVQLLERVHKKLKHIERPIYKSI